MNSIASISRAAVSQNRRGRFQLDLFGARPSFQFYPGDWQRNAKLRMCSLTARGLWLEMMCIMHQAEPYGHLRIGPQLVTSKILARVLGISTKDILALLGELEQAGVFTRESDGTIVCRRMISDERIRQSRAAGGVKSLDNPRVPQRKDILDGTHGGPPEGHNAVPSPSSSFSSSSSNDVDDVRDSQAKNDLEVRLRTAGFTGCQIRIALGRGVQCAEACLAYLDSPPDDAESPIKVIAALLRDGDPIPAAKPRPPAPISPEDREKYGATAHERVLAKHPNLRGAGLSVSLAPAIDREIRALIALEAQCGAA